MPNTVFVLVIALLVVAFVLRLLRNRTLREKYAALWILVGALIVVLVAFPGLLGAAASLLGFAVPSNLLFLLAIVLLLGVTLHLSLELSRLEDETRVLAEEAAIARLVSEQLGRRLSALEASLQDRPGDARSGESSFDPRASGEGHVAQERSQA